MNTNPVNINTVVDEAKFTHFHWSVLIWCLLIIIFDGYDLVIYGVALPLLMQEWGLSAVQAGLLASTALFGMIEPYRVCRRVNILRDYPDDKIKIYP